MPANVPALGVANAPILIVEDDDDVAAALEDLLGFQGFATKTARSPDSATALLESEHFSLVLADYHFGNVAAAEATALSLLRAAAPTPVACVTGWNAVPDSLRDRYAFLLSKPFDAETLLAAVAPLAAAQGQDADRAGVVARYFEALGKRDWQGLVDLCTDDVVYHLPGNDSLCGTVNGRAALHAYTKQTFAAFRDARFEVTQTSWLPRGAIASYRGSWRLPSGQRAEAAGAVCFEFQGQAIARIGVRTDLRRLRADLRAGETRSQPEQR